MDKRLDTQAANHHPFRRALGYSGAATKRSDDQDLKLFVLSFTAFFICFYTLIM